MTIQGVYSFYQIKWWIINTETQHLVL